jgi:hypothetical protein
MEKGKIDNDTHDRIRFITFIIPKFADEYQMNRQEAYLYFKKYGGVQFIFDYWWTLHVDNPFFFFCEIHDVCH